MELVGGPECDDGIRRRAFHHDILGFMEVARGESARVLAELVDACHDVASVVGGAERVAKIDILDDDVTVRVARAGSRRKLSLNTGDLVVEIHKGKVSE